jgi:hypothetical protein
MSDRILDDLQRLTYSQNVLLHRLVDLGYLSREQTDTLLERLVDDRLSKAQEYLAFVQQLDAADPLNQPHIVSRCYYAMYHVARAVVLDFRRSDLDDHERLPGVLGTDHWARVWRKVGPLAQDAESGRLFALPINKSD